MTVAFFIVVALVVGFVGGVIACKKGIINISK